MRQWTIRTKLIVAFILMATLPICMIGFRSYVSSTRTISQVAQNNAYEITKKNNQIIDDKLAKIDQASMLMLTDKDLYRTLNAVDPSDPYSLVTTDREIRNIVNRYFEQTADLFSAQLLTSYFYFGDGKRFIPENGFAKSRLKAAAEEAGGALVWIPTYDFTEMFDQSLYRDIDFESRYLLSAVKLLNLMQINNSEAIPLDAGKEKPVLVVNLREDIFRREFRNSLSVDGTYSFVVSPDGRIVSHPERGLLSRQMDEPWLAEAFDRRSGTMNVRMDGQEMIVCFDTSTATGWLTVMAIPSEQLTRPLLDSLRADLFTLALVLIAISLTLAFVISGRIIRPMRKLLSAIKKLGTGNFDAKVPVERRDEMNQLLVKFNEMNDNIRTLIEENYNVKLREKEAHIMALTLQINPHFLYNSLNIINWIAIENEQQEVSDMLVSLSSMLQYTTANSEEIVGLQDELNWLRNYVFIMNKRFEEGIELTFHIEQALYAYGVPKLFLQPFVENAIIHGFKKMNGEKRIRIEGRIQGDVRRFRIFDNGLGMDEATRKRIAADGQGTVGIRNVADRLRWIYGSRSEIRVEAVSDAGTVVTLLFPLSKEQKEIPSNPKKLL